jgi:class 3 adenylate cyclase
MGIAVATHIKDVALILVALNVLQLFMVTVLYYSFCTYSYHVQEERLQMEQKSTKALEFVSNMFPEKLHQRFFENSGTCTSNTINTGSQHVLFVPPSASDKVQSTELNENSSTRNDALDVERGLLKSTHSHLTNTTATNTTSNNDRVVHVSVSDAPIAELYPETTIMLADLVGFTAWSAAHEPSEVFLLLETIFYEFDLLAVQRDVYKVETVGDCYVAVAGVPEPRPDHAVVMCRFARECMLRFKSIVIQLEARFGSGTRDLSMRIGLNSGPITGGILRGERSRFQLFGDTINTAARMESNSCEGRIQLSETTAQLLFNANKRHWLIKRDDEVEAKGKGNLQTYWLSIQIMAQ